MTLDSRAAKPRGIRPLVRHRGVLIHGEPVYCVSCGHQSGFTTFGMDRRAGPVIFLCAGEDACGCDCTGRFGVPPEMLTPVPDPDDYTRSNL